MFSVFYYYERLFKLIFNRKFFFLKYMYIYYYKREGSFLLGVDFDFYINLRFVLGKYYDFIFSF